MWRKIFDPDSYFWRPLGYLGELVMLSLLWTVCCLPVVTAGQATASLNRSALLLALGQMPRSIAMALVVLLAARLFLYRFTTVFFSPGIAALLCSYLLEPVFQRLIPAAEDEQQPSEDE